WIPHYLFTKAHQQPPVLAFLDIKSAYDTVDRNIIWRQLHLTAPPHLCRLIQHLFDDVSITVMQQNFQSIPFHPSTGVLQGSILSPLLYSLYINSLPSLLRIPLAISPTTPPVHALLATFTCLLYADDVALIATPTRMRSLLSSCEQHSVSLGYCWSPGKCVIVPPNPDPTSCPTFTIYNTPIQQASSFTYLGVPFTYGGKIDRDELIRRNSRKMHQSLNVMYSLGVNASGFSRLLSTRFYQQFLRPQLEYGLAISTMPKIKIKKLDSAQDTCIRRIFDAHDKSSTMVMKHLTRTPSMLGRYDILRFKYLHRSTTLPTESLLRCCSSGKMVVKIIEDDKEVR
ncbi:hypothetical protein, partial, partial [Absidia glauca]